MFNNLTSKWRQKGSATIIIICIIAALVIGAGVFYYVNITNSIKSESNIINDIAKKAPYNTQIMLAIDGNALDKKSEAYSAYVKKTLGIALKNQKAKNVLNNFIPEDSGINIENDVFPCFAPSGALMASFDMETKKDAKVETEAKDENKDTEEIEGSETDSNKVNPEFLAGMLKIADKAKLAEVLKKLDAYYSEKENIKYTEKKLGDKTVYVAQKAPCWCIDGNFLYVGTTEKDLQYFFTPREQNKSLSDNADFKEAISKIKEKNCFLLYGNLKEFNKKSGIADRLKDGPIKELLASTRYIVSGTGLVQKDKHQFLQSSGILSVDPKTYGDLGKDIFNESYNVSFPSLKMHPADSDCYIGINVKMLWKLVYAFYGITKEGAVKREMPAMILKGNNIDLDEDILNVLTGELAFSNKGMGHQAAKKVLKALEADNKDEEFMDIANKSTDITQLILSTPGLLSLGYHTKSQLDKTVNKVAPLKALLSTPTEKVKDVPFYGFPSENPKFYIALSQTELLASINSPITSLTDIFKSTNYKSLSTTDAFKGSEGFIEEDTKSAFIFYQDLGTYYKGLVDELKGSKKADKFTNMFKPMSELYGVQTSRVTVHADSINYTHTVELTI